MEKKIKRLLKGKDARTLIENFFSLFSLRMVGLILPLITLPYILRVVGFSNYGIIMLATSLIAYFQSVTDYSFLITATRDVAIFKGSPKKLNIIYSKVLMTQTLFLIISLIVINLIVYLSPQFYENKLIFQLTTLSLVGHVLFPEWYFRGIEKMKYISIFRLIIMVIFTAGVFIFIKSSEDFWVYPLLQSSGLIGAGLIGQYIIIKKHKIQFYLLSFRRIKTTIVANFPIFINQFFPTLYSNTSSFLVGIILSPYFLGIYSALRRILLLEVSLIKMLTDVSFPFLNRRKSKFSAIAKIILTISVFSALIPLLFSNLIFWYLNIDHNGAFWILAVMNLGLIFLSFYYVFGTNYFIVNRRDKLVMRNTIISSLVGLSLAFPLIYYFNILGAAMNVALSQAFMGLGLYYQYRKENDHSWNFK